MSAFGETFWKFVETGGYEIRQASDTGKPIFYRFQKPADECFLAMVELFARAPDGFLTAVAFGTSIDPKALQLGNVTVTEVVGRIAQAYEFNL